MQAPVSWLRGAALGARASIVEFEPRQGVTALEALVPIPELGTMIEGGVAVSAHPLCKKCNLAGGGHAGSAGPHRRYYAVNVVTRRRRSGGLLPEISCAAPRVRRTTGTRASCESKGSVLDSAVGVRVGCAIPPSPCQLPVLKVPGWGALGFALGLWVAPKRFPGAGTEAEEAGEGGTAPCWPRVYVLL